SEQADKEVILYNNDRISHKELDERVSALAQGLRQLGVEKGDRVAVSLYNCSQYFEVLFAVNRIGAVFLPLNYRLASDELSYILNNAEAKALISEDSFIEKINSIEQELIF